MTHYPDKPLTRAFRPDKQGARRHYGSHPYFTKRAWNVVQEYIRHFTSEGDVVLDPFGGSGVTAVESLVLRRRSVYADINEWACFLARQTALAPVDIGRLRDAFLDVKGRCEQTIRALWRESNEALAGREVQGWYPREVRLPDNADVRTVEELFTPRMLHGLACLRAGIDEIADAQARDLCLLAFSSALVRINRTFLSASNRRESRGGSAVFSLYRYKVSKDPVELPLWEQFEQRFKKLVQAKQETNRLIGDFYREGDTAVFEHASATRLGAFVRPESVDYVYTDPPYGAHISYLDLSAMWLAWLKMHVSARDRAEEVIEGGQLKKSREAYVALLSKSLREMARALKPRAWMSIVFAHRDTSYWDALVGACEAAGLRYVNTVVQPVGVVWSMHKKKNPMRVLSGELVLNFRKMPRRRRLRSKGEAADPVRLVLETCAREIAAHLGATTEHLHHVVIPVLLEAGVLSGFRRERGDLTPLLEETFEFCREEGRWQLRPENCFRNVVGAEALCRYFVRRALRGADDPGQTAPEDVMALLEELGLPDGVLREEVVVEALEEARRCPEGHMSSKESQALLF